MSGRTSFGFAAARLQCAACLKGGACLQCGAIRRV